MRLLVAAVVALAALLMCHATWGSWQQEEDEVQLPEVDADLLASLQPASRSSMPFWLDLHEKLAAEVAAAKKSGGAEVVLYGDSITEAFRGSSVGMVLPGRWEGNSAAWQRHLGGAKALALGISGDQTVHLHWRLLNGEGPAGLRPRAASIMIGTNDLAHLTPMFPDDDERVARIISLGVQLCVRELRKQAPDATLVVLGLLPLQPMMLHSPQRMFDAKIAATNRALRAFVEGQASDRLRFKDCGPGFLDDSGALKRELMPDGIHPEGEGGEVLLSCIMGAIGGP